MKGSALVTVLLVAGSFAAAAPITDDFTGANGAPWSSQWSFEGVASDISSWNIQNNRGVFQPIYFNTGVRALFYINNSSATDVDQTVLFNFAANASWFGLMARRSDADSDTYYYTTVRGASYPYRYLNKMVDGVVTSLSQPGGTIIETNTDYMMRFVCQDDPAGTALKMKVWLASAAEPDEWEIDIVDTEPRLQDVNGRFGIYFGMFYNSGLRVDDYSAVPEPATVGLIVLGGLGMLLRRRRC